MSETPEATASLASRSTGTRAAPAWPDDNSVRVNPTLALFVLLDDMNVTLAEVRDELRQRPSGKIAVITATQTATIPYILRLDPPWYGFVLTNDGPDPLQVQVGDDVDQWATIKSTEVLPVDMGGPVVSRILLRVAVAGQQATYRLFGTY